MTFMVVVVAMEHVACLVLQVSAADFPSIVAP